MHPRSTIIHITVCAVVGGILAEFTQVKWLAGAFWVSAAMFVNGSLAFAEDARPGGFDNPDGLNTSSFGKGWGATRFALWSVAVTAFLVAAGCYVQFA